MVLYTCNLALIIITTIIMIITTLIITEINSEKNVIYTNIVTYVHMCICEQPWPSQKWRCACHEIQGLNPEKVIGGVRKGIQPLNASVLHQKTLQCCQHCREPFRHPKEKKSYRLLIREKRKSKKELVSFFYMCVYNNFQQI